MKRSNTLKGKSTDALMRHIRDDHGIMINGSGDKKKLIEMGYYHGYKAYRYKITTSNILGYSKFSQVVSVYDFDNEMKRIFYPHVMKLETMLKNIVIEEIVSKDDVTFEHIYDEKLNYQNEFNPDGISLSNNNRRSAIEKYKKAQKKKLKLKQSFNRAVSEYYGRRDFVEHFVHKGEPIPLWAHFELITLGTFGAFVSCLNSCYKISIAQTIGTYHSGEDADGTMLEKHIFIIKELRNSVAHNSVIFDTRFRTLKVSNSIKDQLTRSFGVNRIEFNKIIDYLFLVLYYLKPLKFSKTDLRKLIKSTETAIQTLQEKLEDDSIFFSIIGTDYKDKIKKMYEYI